MFDKGPNDIWKDDDSFKNLSKKEEFKLHRLSWHCASLECGGCDTKIHYKIKRFKYKQFDAKTGKEEDIYEEFEWNTSHTSVQLESGVTQSKLNTPEGSDCQCFCHKPRPHNAGPPQFPIGDNPEGKETVDTRPKVREFTKEEKESLK